MSSVLSLLVSVVVSAGPAAAADSAHLPGARSPQPSPEAAKTDSSAPSVVFLSPRFSTPPSPQDEAAAQSACDRLAQEIAGAGLARVVDRTQLDRALQERQLSGELLKPMLSYDAMIRLEIDVPRPVPEARLTLLDLSYGNVMKEGHYGWPLAADDLRRMRDQCRAALKQIGRSDKNKKKVRCLGVANQEFNDRMAPLAERLEQMFAAALARSPQLTPVGHLEAASAKEESLLLLMGLSRLGGGREFTPQADAAVELHLREGDGRGKTFAETPIEITVRVTRGKTAGKAASDESFVVRSKVGQFDQAARQAWEKLAGLLGEAQPGAATGWLDEMAVRRRQAEAELRAARAVPPWDWQTHDERNLQARLAHAEAAVKIDPTLEDAVFEYLVSLAGACSGRKVLPGVQASLEREERFLVDAVDYFDRFAHAGAHHDAVYHASSWVIRFALGDLFGYPGSGAFQLGPPPWLSTAHWGPQRLRMIDKTKQILEFSLKREAPAMELEYQAMLLSIVGRAMQHQGVPLAERQRWVDGIVRQCAQNEAEATRRLQGGAKDQRIASHCQLLVCAAELAVEDGCPARARKLLMQVRARVAAQPGVLQHRDVLQQIRWLLVTLQDGYADRLKTIMAQPEDRGPALYDLRKTMDAAPALVEFDRWRKNLNSSLVLQLSMSFPDIAPSYGKTPPGLQVHNVRLSFPSVLLRQTMSPDGHGLGLAALAADEKRLYVLMGEVRANWNCIKPMLESGQSQVIAAVPLDAAGHPIGKSYPPAKPEGERFWDTLKPLAQPRLAKPLQVLAARCVAGKLCLGTRRNGLLVYDPQSEKWAVFGPEQGLPDEAVDALYPLDDHTLLCLGIRAGVAYTVELPAGKVTLRHRVPDNAFPWRATLLWGRSGACGDLPARQAAFPRHVPPAPYGWNVPGGKLRLSYGMFDEFTGVAEISGRRFVADAGLHEFDAGGKFLRSWWERSIYLCHGGGNDYALNLPADCPLDMNESAAMVAMGDILVFVQWNNILAFDPRSDTWYGPLLPPLVRSSFPGPGWSEDGIQDALGTRAGLWLATCHGLRFVAADDVLAKAESVDRVITTGQYRQRQQALIAAMPLLDRAKAAFVMHQFDKAKTLLQQVLTDEPESADALLLMGHVHDVWCLNQPNMALQFYERLAKVASNRNASFTGCLQRMILLGTLQRWPETLAVADEIEQRFPRVWENDRHTIESWRSQATKHVSLRSE